MATTDNLVKVGQLQTVLTRVKSELDTLDGKTFSSAAVSGGKINFYASTDHTGDPIESVDLPEEFHEIYDELRYSYTAEELEEIRAHYGNRILWQLYREEFGYPYFDR